MDSNSLIKDIGRSYIVSSLLPAALFVMLGFFLFNGFIFDSLVSGLERSLSVFGNQWLFGLILTFWIAFYLFSSVDRTVKLFEGMYFPEALAKYLKDKKREYLFRKRYINFSKLQHLRYKKIKTKKLTKEENREWWNIYDKAKDELYELEAIAPLDENLILPTRLGNILLASELYFQEKYGVEGVNIWPRLFHVLPGRFLRNFEEKYNHLIFLLNSALLIFVNAAGCIIVGMLGILYQLSPNFGSYVTVGDDMFFFVRGFALITPFEYILTGMILCGFGYGLYSTGVNTARDYTTFVRSGFDLYRIRLLKQLNRKLPGTLKEEKEVWQELNEFLILGNRLGVEDLKLEYVYHHDDKTDDKKEDV